VRWVQQPAMRPHHCAVFPQVAGSNSRRGFFDTGNDFRERDHCYISVEAVEHLASSIGWQPSSAFAPLTATINKQAGELEHLKQKLAEAEKFREAAEYTMNSMGQKVRNKPGRPKKEVVG
jgi:hypothetical protein